MCEDCGKYHSVMRKQMAQRGCLKELLIFVSVWAIPAFFAHSDKDYARRNVGL